jgi:hypothetical protein
LTEFHKNHARVLFTSSKISNFIQESKDLVNGLQDTLQEMDVNLEKIVNLEPQAIMKLITNFNNAYDLIKDISNSANFKVYIFPPSEDLNMDLSIFKRKFDDLTKTSFFKSKYPMLDYDIFLKGYGILADKDSYETIMPNFLGIPVTKFDSNSISLTLLLSDVGIVFGVALPINSKTPNNYQISQGVDAEGNKVSSSQSKAIYNINNDLDPIILTFNNLNVFKKFNLIIKI